MTAPFLGCTGRGVRVAVIDSGVNPAHPHIHGIAGGITIGDGEDTSSYVDLLGHGTAVIAAIQEKAADAEYYAVRVFCNALRTRIECLAKALEWCLDLDVDVINLSLGTANAAHWQIFEPLVARAAARGILLVAPREAGGRPALPGSLPGVIAVELDDDCPRDRYRCQRQGGRIAWRASGYPRPLPGAPVHRNLQGVSFAVANMAGFLVRACEGHPRLGYTDMESILAEEAERFAVPAG